MDPTQYRSLGLASGQTVYLSWIMRSDSDACEAEALISLSQTDVEPLDTGCVLWYPGRSESGTFEARHYTPAGWACQVRTPDLLSAVEYAAWGPIAPPPPPTEAEIRATLEAACAPGAEPLTWAEILRACGARGH